eukprot:15480114-Alexandrium_andersonii.AAC.1
MENLVSAIFHRKCKFNWDAYFNVKPDQSQIDAEVAWAESRPAVRKRKSQEERDGGPIFAPPPNVDG